MKRLLNIIFILALGGCLMLFGIVASAQETEEYTVCSVRGEYKLYSSREEHASPILSTDSFSSVLEYIYTATPKASIIFSGVSSSESIHLKGGEYRIYGDIELLDGAGIIIDGGKMIFSSVDIALNTGNIRVKRGSLEMYSGSITSCAQYAVLLDYSSAAEFSVFDGKISTQSDKASVMLKHGTLTVSGGKIENSCATAIESSSTLVLSGTPLILGDEYGIVTSVPLTLSDGKTEFLGNVRVKFCDSFEKGGISCVAYMASETSLGGISLFDHNGEAKELKYFNSYSGINETDFGAVYSPYKVEFYDSGKVLFSQYLLRGETVSIPKSPEKEGYRFLGWRYQSDKGEFYEFSASVAGDTVLHASYELEKPKYELKSLSFVYDTLDRRLKFNEISHPLLSEGVISYSWYKNGKCIQNFSDSVNIKNVSDSGEYYCNITFSVAGDSVSFNTVKVAVSVQKATVELPVIPSVKYNGNYQYPDISSNGIYSVEYTGGILVGAYPVLITITDFENYCFSDGDTKSKCLDFVVEKTLNYWVEDLKVGDIYTGMIPLPTAVARFGQVRILYSDTKNGEYTAIAPNIPGSYYAKAIVDGSENYYTLESEPMRFSVIEELAVGISILELPKKMEYTAFECFDPEGISVGVTYSSGRSEFLGADALQFSYQSDESFRYGDTLITVIFEGVSASVRVTVKKAEYDLSNLIFEDATAEYDSNYKTICFSGELPTGLDGIALNAVTQGGSAMAGSYTVALIFSSESQNYIIPENMYATLTVTPRATEIFWEGTSFVYDGTVKVPSAYYIDAHGRKIRLSVSGGRSYAGEYIAFASGEDTNYSIVNPSVSFTVMKADYDMSKAVWIGKSQYYDGTEKSVSLTNLPEGVSVIGYLDNKAIDSGEYLATASFSYDEHNYNPPAHLSCLWEILPASYTTDGFWFSDAEYVYDGVAHYPLLFGDMPTGADGISLKFEYGEGIVNVCDGRAVVEIIFTTESQNYLPPPNMTAYVEIKPRGITVSWHSLEFTYDGEAHAPYALAKESKIYVSEGFTGAGRYTARAFSADANYYVVNSECDFVISKAQNAWHTALTVSDIFYGQKPNPSAKAGFGELAYLYYSDSAATEEIEEPTAVGRYFVKALGYGDDNHLPIESEIIPFSIIAIIPIGISVELETGEYVAFDLILPSDFTAYLKNNDGSAALLDSEDVQIVYSSSDSLRPSDKTVRFVYRDFTAEAEVNVKKRDYDLSNVTWQNLLHVYDGSEKSAHISGLPKGISIISYTGNGAVGAGEYTVAAVLDYDKENYNEPKIESAVLKIEKQVVFLSEIDGAVYSGKDILPKILKSELYEYEFAPVHDAGVYDVTFSIKDPLNYTFTNGEDSICMPFVVEKICLTIKVCDVTLHLFEKEILTSFSITEGELVSGDSLDVSYLISEDEISAAFNNPNYDITVVPGRIDRVKALSRESLKTLLIIVFVFVAGSIALVSVILNRKRLYRYYRAVLCRAACFNDEMICEPTEEIVKEDIHEAADDETRETPILNFEAVNEVEKQTDAESKSSIDDGFTAMINADYADNAITDSLARDLIRRDENTVVTNGYKKEIINVDTLSRSFSSGERVDVNILKERSLVPYDTAFIKVLARGIIDKPLFVYANDFSLSAVKMIALAGGKSIKVTTDRKKGKER